MNYRIDYCGPLIPVFPNLRENGLMLCAVLKHNMISAGTRLKCPQFKRDNKKPATSPINSFCAICANTSFHKYEKISLIYTCCFWYKADASHQSTGCTSWVKQSLKSQWFTALGWSVTPAACKNNESVPLFFFPQPTQGINHAQTFPCSCLLCTVLPRPSPRGRTYNQSSTVCGWGKKFYQNTFYRFLKQRTATEMLPLGNFVIR